ncbi:threonine/homoserine/homoserine lactone efflux protein [Comamonas sp. 4034]
MPRWCVSCQNDESAHLYDHKMTTTMTIVDFTAFLVLATAMSFTPGPNTTMAAAMGANWGLRPAMRFVWGVPVGWCALLLLCASGVGALVMAAPVMKTAIKAVGIAYLVWLAYKLSGSGKLAEAKDASLIGFWQGVCLQFVNVKAWLLALAIVAGWIVGFEDQLMRLAIVVPIMLLYAFASNLLYASVGALLRTWLAQGQRLLWFNRAMALVLVLTAVWMIKA